MRAIKKGSLFIVTLLALTWQACDPPGPAALLRGERMIAEGRYAGAIESLREATSLLPDNPQAWNHLGLAYHWAREYNPAVQSYRQALKLNYDLAPARFNLGSLLLEINQAEMAAVEFAAYTELEPSRPGGWVRRGLAEWRSRKWDAAHESFETALRLDAAQPVVWNSIGVIELYRRNHMAAFNAFREALRYQVDYPPAVYNAALIAHFYLPRDTNDPRPYALEKYREYLALSPEPLFGDAISRLERQLDLELNPRPTLPVPPPIPPKEAKTQAPATLTREESAPITRTNIPSPPTPQAEAPKPPVVVAKAVTRPPPQESVPPPKPVVAPPSKIRASSPTVPAPSTVTVTTTPPPAQSPSLESSNSTPIALAEKVAMALEQSTRSTPPPPPSPPDTSREQIIPGYGGLNYAYYNPPAPSPGFRHKAKPFFDDGRRLQRLGRYSDAIAAYQRAIHWDGAYFEAYHNLGLAAAEAKDFLRSAVAYETALALQPQSAATRYNFALLLSAKDYHRDAAIELEKLLQQDPSDVRAHLLLATLYDKNLGLLPKARDHYEAVLQLNPAHSQGTAIRYWLKSH